MPKYRKKPVVIEAYQWDGVFDKIVKPHPAITGHKICEHCGKETRHHGWVETLEGGHSTCHTDFIITGVRGEHYPCKQDIFAETYDEVPE